MRINKFLSESGVCSRRHADQLVLEGRVCIDGEKASVGDSVEDGQNVTVDGRIIENIPERYIYALYKPIGYICSMSDEQGTGLSCFVPKGMRLYPVGRLDKDSEGLVLLTNDGEFMNSVLRASEGHEKEYIVTVDRVVTDAFVKGMSEGVRITSGATGRKVMTAPCRVIKTGQKAFDITLIQGLNRQIRRMCGFFGYKVISLKRIRIMNVELGNMKPGELRRIDFPIIQNEGGADGQNRQNERTC